MNAIRISTLGALAACLLSMPGCDDKKADDKKADAKADDKKADGEKADDKADEADAQDAKDEADGEDAEAAEAGAEAAGGEIEKIGVAVCDEYIEKYGKCIAEHAPDNMKTQMKEALAKSAERFKAQSEGPEKDTLDQSCTAALEAVKKTSKGWGCTYE